MSRVCHRPIVWEPWFRAMTLVAVLALSLPAANGQSEEPNDVVIELFLRRDSEQCQRAQDFLMRLESNRAGIEVRVHDVIEDRDELARLWALSKRFGREKAGVPTVHLVKRLIVGFRDDQTTGRDIEDLLVHQGVRPARLPTLSRGQGVSGPP